MTSFAFYRLPYQHSVDLIWQRSGSPLTLSSCHTLGTHQGFLLAPFDITSDQPLLLIHPDEFVRVPSVDDVDKIAFPFDDIEEDDGNMQHNCQSTRTTYAEDFAAFHSQLITGNYRKIVLARCAMERRNNQYPSAIELFKRACLRYPRLFVSLVFTPQSGLWLTATPEILLEGDGRQWRTVALAGTMQLDENELSGEGENVCWSTKNIQEQRYVATYLSACLKQFTNDFQEEGPRTVRAANLVHLRSDFTFTLPDATQVGPLLHTLHPTPAVCGLPKQDAFRFILQEEHCPRQYYSGFQGPLFIEASTHLYVSLRCMQVLKSHYRMYAGGGLLKDSEEEQEWQETEAKLETMRRCIATKTT